MAKYKLEYIWLDGYTPLASLRSKTQIKEFGSFPKLEDLPAWGFDGSSTQQAEGKSSDIVLKPVAVYPDSTRKNGVLVMCETYLHTGVAHPSNSRATIPDDPDTWFGFEQEYFFYKDGAPLGFPTGGYPAPQGPYYTGVGYKNVGCVAREIVEKHIDICLDAGINLEGINAEVAKGQWEFQIFGKGSKSAADQMWVARYILTRLTESYGIDIEWRCKPVLGAFNQPLDWNGSGMHSNFSTKFMREVGGKEYFEKLMAAFNQVSSTSISPSMARRIISASPACMRRSRSTSSVTVSPIAVLLSACRIASSTTATRVTLRTVVRIPPPTRTWSPVAFSRRSRPCRPSKPTIPLSLIFAARSQGRAAFLWPQAGPANPIGKRMTRCRRRFRSVR